MKFPHQFEFTDDEWGNPYTCDSPCSIRNIIRRCLWSYHGTRFTYGTAVGHGDDPLFGVDCTGFISLGLRVIGMLGKRERLNTVSLWTYYGKYDIGDYHSPWPLDVTCFFENEDDVKPCHAEWYWGPGITYGASGGTRETDTEEEAAERNAFVQCAPLEGRFPHYRFLRVFGPWGRGGPPK